MAIIHMTHLIFIIKNRRTFTENTIFKMDAKYTLIVSTHGSKRDWVADLSDLKCKTAGQTMTITNLNTKYIIFITMMGIIVKTLVLANTLVAKTLT